MYLGLTPKGEVTESEVFTSMKLEEGKEMKEERLVILNSGIAHAWDVRHALDLIHLHPDGPRVAADFKPSLAQ